MNAYVSNGCGCRGGLDTGSGRETGGMTVARVVAAAGSMSGGGSEVDGGSVGIGVAVGAGAGVVDGPSEVGGTMELGVSGCVAEELDTAPMSGRLLGPAAGSRSVSARFFLSGCGGGLLSAPSVDGAVVPSKTGVLSNVELELGSTPALEPIPGRELVDGGELGFDELAPLALPLPSPPLSGRELGPAAGSRIPSIPPAESNGCLDALITLGWRCVAVETMPRRCSCPMAAYVDASCRSNATVRNPGPSSALLSLVRMLVLVLEPACPRGHSTGIVNDRVRLPLAAADGALLMRADASLGRVPASARVAEPLVLGMAHESISGRRCGLLLWLQKYE